MPFAPQVSNNFITTWVRPYAKAVLAFLLGLAQFVLTLLSGGAWNLQDTISLVAWLSITLGVHQVENKPAANSTGQVN